jgi:hypothetical protein
MQSGRFTILDVRVMGAGGDASPMLAGPLFRPALNKLMSRSKTHPLHRCNYLSCIVIDKFDFYPVRTYCHFL